MLPRDDRRCQASNQALLRLRQRPNPPSPTPLNSSPNRNIILLKFKNKILNYTEIDYYRAVHGQFSFVQCFSTHSFTGAFSTTKGPSFPATQPTSVTGTSLSLSLMQHQFSVMYWSLLYPNSPSPPRYFCDKPPIFHQALWPLSSLALDIRLICIPNIIFQKIFLCLGWRDSIAGGHVWPHQA